MSETADRPPGDGAMPAGVLPAGDEPVPVLPLSTGSVPDGDGASTTASWLRPPPPTEQRDWKWIEEWRAGGEPTPWGPGLAVAGFAALLIGTAVYVISSGLRDYPAFAVGANLVIAAGLTPALWMSRQLPVLRWIALGAAVGTVVAWVSLLFFRAI